MCLIETLNKPRLIFTAIIITFAMGIFHIIVGFMRSVPDFSTYALFNIAPITDFSVGNNCYNKQTNVFHVWGGWNQLEWDFYNNRFERKYYDATPIKIINGKYFCYNRAKKTYMDLLNNGQIISNGTECPEEYKKNCGRIDTLNQELCIKEDEKCPLYDVGIGNQEDTNNYIYDIDSNVYYSKDTFNIQNKAIIARFNLSDGQPCYDDNETLWRKFSSKETVASHLTCTKIKILNKGSDDRYKARGYITYKRLYQDNLSSRAKDKIMNDVGYEVLYLYTREFFGVNKTCNENFNITDISNLKFSQNADKIIEIVQGFIMAIACLVFFFVECKSLGDNETTIPGGAYCWIYLSYIIMSLGFLIAKIVAFVRAKKFGGEDDYNCSDSITNELIKVGNENNRKAFTYSKICLFGEVSLLGINFLVFIVGLIIYLFDNISLNFNGYKPHNDYKDYKEDPAVEIPYANYPSYPASSDN